MMQIRFPFEMKNSFYIRSRRDIRIAISVFHFFSRLCASSSNCCWLLLSPIQQLHQSGHFRNARAQMHLRKTPGATKLVRTRHRHSAFTQSKPTKQASRAWILSSFFRAWIEAKKFFHIIRVLHSIFSAFKSIFNAFFPNDEWIAHHCLNECEAWKWV